MGTRLLPASYLCLRELRLQLFEHRLHFGAQGAVGFVEVEQAYGPRRAREARFLVVRHVAGQHVGHGLAFILRQGDVLLRAEQRHASDNPHSPRGVGALHGLPQQIGKDAVRLLLLPLGQVCLRDGNQHGQRRDGVVGGLEGGGGKAQHAGFQERVPGLDEHVAPARPAAAGPHHCNECLIVLLCVRFVLKQSGDAGQVRHVAGLASGVCGPARQLCHPSGVLCAAGLEICGGDLDSGFPAAGIVADAGEECLCFLGAFPHGFRRSPGKVV